MKKFLAFFLMLVLCFTASLALVACGDKEEASSVTIDDALEYLKSAYKSDEGKKTSNDYSIPAKVVIENVTFTVTWTVDNDAIKIVYDDAKGLYTVDLPDVNETEANYKLTATIKNESGESRTAEFGRVLAVIKKVSGVVTDLEADTAYKIFMDQKNLALVLFVTAEADGTQFLKSVTDPKTAPDFFVEVVDGGYKIYTVVSDVKMYMHATASPRAGEEGKFDKAIALSKDNASVFKYKEDINAWYTTINTTPDADVANNIDFAVGTYGTYKTLCISETSYYTPENTGVEQFPMQFITKEAGEAMTPSEEIPDPTTVTPIKDVVTKALAQEHNKYTVEKYLIEGVITEIKNTQFGNMYVKDAAGDTIYVYGCYDVTGEIRYDELETKPQVGDTVKLMGIVGQYNDVAQMKNAQIVSHTAKTWTDAEKVAAVKDALTVSEIKANKEITLPATDSVHTSVTITWAVKEGYTGTAATFDATTGKLTVVLQDEAETITLVATIKSGNETATKEITVNIAKKPTIAPVKVDAPTVGTPYKMALMQVTLDKFLYFAGTATEAGFLNTTEDYTAATDVLVEEVTAGSGNFRLYFVKDNAKQYIEIFLNSSNQKRLRIVPEAEATAVWTWDADLGIYVYDVNPDAETTDNYYIGTYQDFATLSPSGTYRIEGDNAAAAGVTQFVAYFYTMVDASTVSDADKVADEKEKLVFSVGENVEEAIENQELPTVPKTYGEVTITWAVTEGASVATITDGKLNVTIPAIDTADVVVKLTATIAIGTTTETKEFTFTVKAPISAVILSTKVPYNFYMYQANDAFKKNLYFAGTTVSGKSYQLATTDNAAEAVQVWLEAVADVEGAYRVYFYDAANENAKTYIKVTSYGTDGGTIALTTEAPTEYFTYSKEFKTLVYKYDGNTIYLGGYNDKDFFSANNTSRITGNNATALGVSQYVAVFSAAPVVGVAYDLGMYNASTNVNYYFFGSMTGNYLATTDTKAVSVPVYAEAVDGVAGGFRLFFYDAANENAKTYIRTYEYQDNKGGVTITTTLPTEYYTFSNELGAIVCTIDDNTYYLGSYDANTYIRVSNISYITGDNASKVGVTQYISVLTAHDFTLSVPDAEKVATENADLSIKTEFQVEGEITLPTTGATYTDVTINWEVADNNGALKLEEGKLIATPQATETTVKVSAIISLNEEEVTKVFDVVVAKKVVLIPTLVTAPVAGGSYYMGLVYEDAYNFLDGSTQNNYNFRLLFTQVYAEMIKFELEETTGGFYLKTTIDEAAKYLNIVKVENNGNTYVNTLYQDTAASVWTWSETYKTLTVTVEGMGEYAITQTGTYNNVEAKTVSTTGVKVQLFNIVDADTISHSDRVAMEKDALDVETTIVTAGDVTLPATGSIFEGVTVTWAVATNDYVTLNGNVITVTLPAVDTTVVLTATISSGDPAETTTKEITLTIKAPNPTPIADVLAENAELASGSTSEKSYIVEGVIYNLVSDYYGNAYIVDENGTTIYVYGLVVDGTEYKSYDGTKVVVGDKVKLYSTVNNFKGTLQLKNAALLSTTLAADVTLNDAEKAVFAADALTVASKIEAVGDTTLTSTNETYGATVVWTVAANDYATVTNNVLTVATLPATSANITLTATVTVGEKTATKTLTVTLATPITIVQVDAATVAAEAKANATDKTSSTFYLFGTPVGDEQLYVTGSLKSKKLTLTNDANAAAKLYLVYVDTVESVDRFYLCFDVSGTRNYISWSSGTDFSVGTTAPTNDYWTVDTTNNTILCAASVRWLRTYNSSGVYDVRPYATTATNGVDTVILGRVSTGA